MHKQFSYWALGRVITYLLSYHKIKSYSGYFRVDWVNFVQNNGYRQGYYLFSYQKLNLVAISSPYYVPHKSWDTECILAAVAGRQLKRGEAVARRTQPVQHAQLCSAIKLRCCASGGAQHGGAQDSAARGSGYVLTEREAHACSKARDGKQLSQERQY